MVMVSFGKRDVWILSVVLIFLVGVGFVVAVWDSGKTMFHSSDDVRVSISGTDYSLQEAVDGGLLSGGGGLVFDGSKVMSNVLLYPGPVSVDLSSIIGARRALVFLRVKGVSGIGNACFKPNGETMVVGYGNQETGTSCVSLDNAGGGGYVLVGTDNNGIIQVKTINSINIRADAFLEWYSA